MNPDAVLRLTIQSGLYAICRLPAGSAPPAWALSGSFASVTLTPEETSIVCAEGAVPADVEAERGWVCLKVAGPLDFALVGILARLTAPLAEAGVSVFAVSTYDTDYLMVRAPDLARAVSVLRAAGHVIEEGAR